MASSQKKMNNSLSAAELSFSDQDFDVKKSASKPLFPGRWAYHVTSFGVDKYPEQPKIENLVGNLALDTYYDGPLLGAAGVFFATSIYWSNMQLPTISPYPTYGKENEEFWRVKVNLTEFNNYDISLAMKDKSQVILVLTRGSQQTAQFRVHPEITELDRTDNPYLCCKDGEWRVSAYKFKAGSDSPFSPHIVNIFVPCGSFGLRNAEWDTVKHGKESARDPMPPEKKIDLHNELWLAKALLVRNNDQEYAELCNKMRFSMRTPSSSSLN